MGRTNRTQISDQGDRIASATQGRAVLSGRRADSSSLSDGRPRQYFAPFRWQEIALPKAIENDLDDIPKLGLAGTLSARNSIGKYPDNQRRMWAAYYAAVAFMDEQSVAYQ